LTLTNSELVAAWREACGVPLPYFGGKDVELFFESEAELRQHGDAIRNFLALGPAHRIADTRHAFAYFKDVTDDVGFEWVDEGMEGLPQNSEQIWKFVTPNSLSAIESWDVGDRDRTRQFIIIEGDCGWEAEHGISLSWRDGEELVKLSAYDGHATNGHAYGDLAKDAYIYYSANAAMCTSRP
jgi:hypothetical protein